MTLKELESELEARGFTPDTRKSIRNAKICIIDDKIEDLRGLTKSLKKEGFSNIVEVEQPGSVSELVDAYYDLIILDLGGVAVDLFDNEGVGLLESLKRSSPELPVLVVSGHSQRVEHSSIISRADLVRNKPIRPGQLLEDVEEILKTRFDRYWAALSILRIVSRLPKTTVSQLGIWQRMRLFIICYNINKDIRNSNPGIIRRINKAVKILSNVEEVTGLVSTFSKHFMVQ